jgi:hypothetical protein
MKKQALYWVGCTLLTSCVVTGVIYKFDSSNIVNLPVAADGHMEVGPWLFGLVTWLLLTFIALLTTGIRNRFTDSPGAWMLLVCNSLLTLLSICMLYILMAVESLSNIFQTREKQLIEYFPILICLTTILLLSTGEFFLIRRIVQIKRVE